MVGAAAGTDAALAAVLGRPVWDMKIEVPLTYLMGKRILVTGAAGSIGQVLAPLLQKNGCDVLSTDVEDLDVTEDWKVKAVCSLFRPEVVFHLAGAKHAPLGEEDPWTAMQINTVGTQNILDSVNKESTRVVTASTCKACNPETAYGASKLLAERMTLNEGHSVARFYNVVETQGNVFEIWRNLPSDEPVPWTDCSRFFISLSEATATILWAAVLPSARYTVTPGLARRMQTVVKELYPNRDLMQIQRRRGDRQTEPLCGSHELLIPVDECHTLREIISPHD